MKRPTEAQNIRLQKAIRIPAAMLLNQIPYILRKLRTEIIKYIPTMCCCARNNTLHNICMPFNRPSASCNQMCVYIRALVPCNTFMVQKNQRSQCEVGISFNENALPQFYDLQIYKSVTFTITRNASYGSLTVLSNDCNQNIKYYL